MNIISSLFNRKKVNCKLRVLKFEMNYKLTWNQSVLPLG